MSTTWTTNNACVESVWVCVWHRLCQWLCRDSKGMHACVCLTYWLPDGLSSSVYRRDSSPLEVRCNLKFAKVAAATVRYEERCLSLTWGSTKKNRQRNSQLIIAHLWPQIVLFVVVVMAAWCCGRRRCGGGAMDGCCCNSYCNCIIILYLLFLLLFFFFSS